jgi:FtsZ-interacting cell division protein ZipA
MHESHGWLLDTRTVWIVLAVWLAAVLVHGLWRSRGEGTQDSIRESGPIL